LFLCSSQIVEEKKVLKLSSLWAVYIRKGFPAASVGSA
jgi:hypothetical protein